MSKFLCVGYNPYDVVPLLEMAARVEDRLGLVPVVISLADPAVTAKVRQQAEEKGYDYVDRVVYVGEWSGRNPLRRLRERWRAMLRLGDELLDEVRPSAVLASVNPPPNLFLDQAAERGVPTLLVQLFTWGDRAFYRDLHADDRRHELSGIPSRSGRLRRRVDRRLERLYDLGPYVAWDLQHASIAVQGPQLRRMMIDEGIPSEHVVATGSPTFDELYDLRSRCGEARARVVAQLGIDGGRRIVSHMRSHEERLVAVDKATRDDVEVQLVRSLRAAAPDAQIVVKMHPRESEVERAFVRSIDPEVLAVGEEISTNELLAASDVVVGAVSTTLVQSVLLDRPTVSAWLWPGLSYFRSCTDWSGVDRVTSTAALTEVVRRHLDDPAYQATWAAKRAAFIEEEFVYDGDSIGNVVDELERLIRAPAAVRSY